MKNASGTRPVFIGSAGDAAGRRRRLIGLLASLVVLCGVTVALPVVARGDSVAGACTGNAVVCENQLPGTPQDDWDIDGAGDDDIQGFATQISVNVGQTEQFKITTPATAYRIEIYRLGWYQGNGARKVADVVPSATLPQVQPACATDSTTEIYDCGTWGVSASWTVPSTAVSGVYIARLIRTSNGDSSHIPFIVRDDSSHAAVVYQTSDPTWQAYNTYGQSDFYQGLANGRAYKVSYNRPITTRKTSDRDFLFSNEYPMLRYMEQNGYDVTYISGLDTDVHGTLLTNHKVFMSIGHDEYWSEGQRTAVENARDAGVNLAFFSGNEVYWKTRWEPSEDGNSTANRTLVCYKDTWANQQIDPLGPTSTWRDPRWGGTGKGPENSLTGTMYMSNFTDLAITVSGLEGKTRLWRNTTLASKAPGSSTALASHTVGYESDEDIDNGHRPAGLVDLSTTVGQTPQYLTDFGNTVVPGTTTHHVTLYKAASGALVFGAGTVQWAWGVDADHDGTAGPADVRMRQATMNLLADMGAVATTIASDLVVATKSTDISAPTAVITSPAPNASLGQGSLVTVSGTASDAGGGVVAGVEVSVDGGTTFHPASGTTSFTYSGVLTGTGARAIQVRATDDSGNTQSPAAALPLQVSCPCSMFGAATPGTLAVDDGSPTTVGVKFSSSADGFITGIRFYKGAANTGTHVGTLYTSSGSALSSVTFTNESATGWQTANFASAVAITAGTTYVAAYTAPVGHYAADNYYFINQGHTAGALTAAGGKADPNNGVYANGSGFPNLSFQNTNYYVDAIYSAVDSAPLTAASNTPLDGASSIATTVSPTAVFSRPVIVSSIDMTVADPTNTPVGGTVSYDATNRRVTFNPTAPLSFGVKYTVRLNASAPDVGSMAAPLSWSFTTVQAGQPVGVCPCSLFSDTDAPAAGPVSDSQVELGIAFSSDTDGTITGIRFYKDPANTGIHQVSLWSAGGSSLATATVASESTSGWQTATFSSPVSISANVTYIASYKNPTGKYSYTSGGLSNPVDASPLHTQASAGRYAYNGNSPTSQSVTNYFVDPIFQPNPDTAPVLASLNPADNASSVPVSGHVTATFTGRVQASSVIITVTGPDGAPVPGSTAGESLSNASTFIPTSPLAASTQYTVTVSGAKSPTGIPMTNQAVGHFTTSGVGSCPCSVLTSNAVPQVSDSKDTAPITLGLKFTPSVNGYVTGLRFYQDAANTGTHTGTLYTEGGGTLATVTFPSATAMGWQTASFSSPVAVTAGTNYVAAYFAPYGHYSATGGFFPSPYVNTPLTGLQGLYAYNSDSFPTSSFNDTNYFVDVAFNTDTASPPVVSSRTPADGAVTSSRSVPITATFNVAVDPTTIQMSVTGPGLTALAGSSSYDAASRTLTFQPSSPLAYGTAYSASILASGVNGTAMVAPSMWSFTTPAAPVPVVSAQTPANGSSAVPLTATVSGQFSVPIDATSLQLQVTSPDGTTLPGSTRYDASSQTATFVPTSKLASSTAYSVAVTAAGTDGGVMPAPARWTFTTAAVAAPTVSNQTPAAGATSVAVSTSVYGTFNAPIDAGSLQFTVTSANGTPVVGAASYDASSGIATFAPTQPLTATSTFTVSLSANGLDGGVMATPVTWSFTTGAPGPAPTVTGRSPVAGATGVAVASSVTGTFSVAVDPASLVFTVSGPGGASVAGSVSYNSTTRVATFKPTAALAYGSTYAVSLVATGSAGGGMAAPVTWSFSTVPPPAPTVTGRSPVAGATGVAVASSVTGTFSVAVDPASLVFTVSGPGGASVAGSVSYNSTTRVATFKPTAALAYGSTYAVSLVATGSAGGGMAAPVTWSFSTVPPPAPTVTGRSPVAGATGVAVASSVTGTFSVAVDPASLVFTVSGPGGASVAGSVSYNSTTRVATFKPTAALAYGSTYAVSLVATGSAGGAMAAPVTWSFSTVPPPAPTVTGRSPVAGATGVAVASSVTGTFSVAVDPASLVFTVSGPGGASVAGSVSYNSTTRVATFKPTAALAYGSTYAVSLVATGSAGGAMAAPVTWSFSTVPPPAPTVTTRSPAAGATSVSRSTPVTATFSIPVTASTIVMTMTSPNGTSVAGSLSYNTTTRVATFQPSVILGSLSSYTASVTATGTSGGTMTAPSSWSFTTRS